ncbi:tRNA epoxyqueuosine(34) reductase QueG [Paremcibacter congregatus]|uniref:tRNA epoxyqueuosine(34) reductase QueG n=1 Tax=Paremcibacter congregatus TaxID=2043170 RepID=UPI003A94F371
MTDPAAAKTHIIDTAKAAGFDVVRITGPDGLDPNAAHFYEFLDLERHGEMAWMRDKADRRSDPRTLWPDVKSIILLAMNYSPAQNPLDTLAHRDRGNISVYARGKDYHDVVKKKLKQVARDLHRQFDAEVKVFVDTAPVMEKPLAAKSGLGWQGKHTNLVSREFGSWLFLGSIFTTLDLPADPPGRDSCGSCRACLDICPTKAFPAPNQLDARRCISYLTIEYKGHIAEEFRKPMGNRIYGCDDCLAVCPWNKYAKKLVEPAYLPRLELAFPALSDLVELDDAGFRQVFSGSPIKRIGRTWFIRNVLIAIGNSADRTLIPKVEQQLTDPSPHIRAMAVWALRQLCDQDQWRAHREKSVNQETDPDVRLEWH